MIKVFLIDDHPMVIEGIKALLFHSENIEIIGSAGNAFLAMEFLRNQQADVVLLDINLPEIDGIELCKKIKNEFPTTKILGLSTFKERSYIAKMIENGASGYVLKSVPQEELTEAITSVFAGKIYLNEEIAQVLTKNSTEANSKTLPLLTRREKEVLICIADGLTNPEIAEKLFVSPLTIDSHRKNLLAKFEVKNTASLIKIAVENGLIS
ncbi:MAG: response regulator transcription factor [Verrucomicrobia bacterium]|nr:response regulator transcription factor [Cytophagales bacterium]